MTSKPYNHSPSTNEALAEDIMRSSPKRKALEQIHEKPIKTIRKFD